MRSPGAAGRLTPFDDVLSNEPSLEATKPSRIPLDPWALTRKVAADYTHKC
jgi:hypothetical protein